MLQPDPVAMLVGAVAFLAVLVAIMAVTAVRRRGQPVAVERAVERTGDTPRGRRLAG